MTPQLWIDSLIAWSDQQAELCNSDHPRPDLADQHLAVASALRRMREALVLLDEAQIPTTSADMRLYEEQGVNQAHRVLACRESSRRTSYDGQLSMPDSTSSVNSQQAIAVSRQMSAFARFLDDAILQTAGERVAFTLFVWTEGRANYISSADFGSTRRALENMFQADDAGDAMPPAHLLQG